MIVYVLGGFAVVALLAAAAAGVASIWTARAARRHARRQARAVNSYLLGPPRHERSREDAPEWLRPR